MPAPETIETREAASATTPTVNDEPPSTPNEKLEASFKSWLNDEANEADIAPLSLATDPSLAHRFLRGCQWNEEQAKAKVKLFAHQTRVLGDCSLSRVAPFLSHGGVVAQRDLHTHSTDAQVLYVLPELIHREHDMTTKDRARAMMHLFDVVRDDNRVLDHGLFVVLDCHSMPRVPNTRAQREVMNLLAALPCKASVVVVRQPWFFSMLFAIVKTFTSSDIISRVSIRDVTELTRDIVHDGLLKRLGGGLEVDARKWLMDEFAIAKQEPPEWLQTGGAAPLPAPEQ